jgi:poly(A) polymerase
MASTAAKIDMSTKVGGRIITPALPVVSAQPPTEMELSFNASLETFCSDVVPLESTEGIQTRERALNRMGKLAREWIQSVCTKKGFAPDAITLAGGQLFTSGSYRLGVHEPGADIDTILVAPNMCTRDDFFGEIMENDKRDPDSLAERIRRHPDVTNFVPVEGAAVPILTFDWEGVNIDLLFARLNSASVPASLDIDNDAILDGVDGATEKSLNGPRVTNLIAKLVSGTPERYQTFLTVVRCVRKWAKSRGLYSNKMGYWGGVNINIAVALCVQLYPVDCPASLLRKFFLVFKTWRWPNPVMLTKPHDAEYGLQVWSPQHSHRQVAPMITPAYPAMNSTLATSRQTLQILHEEFCRGHAMVDQLWKQHQKGETDLNWGQLFEPSDFFIAYPNYLSLCIVGPTQTDAQAWAGFVESRLRKLTSDLLGRSLPLSKIQLWPKKIEACIADKSAMLTKAQRENCITYFIGFQMDMLRMRGKQLNLELQLHNFREWELSKFQPLIPGMDVVAKGFGVKELPRICFPDGDKAEAMKRRRDLRNADPRRQEKKRLKKLQELKAKMAEIQRKKEAEREEAAAAAAEKKEVEGGDEEATVGEKRKREDDEVEDAEELQIKEEVAQIKEEAEELQITEGDALSTTMDGIFLPPGAETSEEADLLENIFDAVQNVEKTREEAEVDRRKLLAGELLDDGAEADGMIDDDEEDDNIYTGARDAYMVLQQAAAATKEQEEQKQTLQSKRSLPLGPEEAEILRKAGIAIVSDDEQKIVGGNMIQPWRQGGASGSNVDGPIESASIKFTTKWDIVELDASGHICDKGDADFSPSKTWKGRMAGFEFKLGERGLGYYRTGKKVVVPSNTAY